MEINRIAIIGGGNIGLSVYHGIVRAEAVPNENITVTRPDYATTINHLTENGTKITGDNIEAVKNSELIVIAVKPKTIFHVLDEIKDAIDPEKHIIASIVTGVTSEEIEKGLGKKVPIFRVMPNTAIAICESITCMSSHNASEGQIAAVDGLFQKLGISIQIKEELMGAATVLGACGIAFALRFIRAASQGGVEIGYDAETAQLIAAQTVKGAAQLLLENGLHPEAEIDKVATPQGITISGLNEMEHQGFSSALIKGLTSSFKKIGG